MRDIEIVEISSHEEKLESLMEHLVNLYLKAYRGLEMYAYTNPHDVRDYIKWLAGQRRHRGKGHVFLVGFKGKELVSFAAGDALWYDKNLGEVANFHELVVSTDIRRRGIGKLMVKKLISEFFRLEPKPRDVMLWVGLDNFPAINLYESLGFQRVDTRGIWHKMVMRYERVKELLRSERTEEGELDGEAERRSY